MMSDLLLFFFPRPGAHGEATIYLDFLLWLHCHLSLCDSQLGTLAHSGGFNKNPKQKTHGHMKYIEETMGWLFFLVDEIKRCIEICKSWAKL